MPDQGSFLNKITVGGRAHVTEHDLETAMRSWRHHLHANPETGFEEHGTARFVAETLASFGLEVAQGIGGTGVVGTLRAGRGCAPLSKGASGAGSSKRAIGLRADMDALAIHEAQTRPHASRNPGRMHACGHDGHMAMLLGAARILADAPGFDGVVRFVFQPAEEHGQGAKAMLGDRLLERFPMEEIYGVHNMPGLPFGRFATRPGPIMAAEDNFIIEIAGRGGHAARPHMAVDSIVVASEIVLALQTIVARNLDPVDQGVVSVTEFVTDGIRNALPGQVILKGDTRSYLPRVRTLIEERMGALVAGICAAHGASHRFHYSREFEPTVNWPDQVGPAVRAAIAVSGPGEVDGDCPPLMASEDFGAFLQAIPGNYMFLGTGLAREAGGVPLHSPHYDFPDALLLKGAQYFAAVARDRLQADS